MRRYTKQLNTGLDLKGRTITNANLVSCKMDGKKLPTMFDVTDITALTAAQLDELKAGDVVVKITGNERHTYIVSYKDPVKGELALTYCDYHNIEEVYYEKVEGKWAYIVTDIFPLT